MSQIRWKTRERAAKAWKVIWRAPSLAVQTAGILTRETKQWAGESGGGLGPKQKLDDGISLVTRSKAG